MSDEDFKSFETTRRDELPDETLEDFEDES
jgi:hypothetical protein